MSECRTDNACESGKSCNCPKCQQVEGCTMAEEILHLAKCAKHELLKEKMKKLLETKMGKTLDKVAEVAVEGILTRMQHKKAKKQACEQYKEDLMTAFMS